MGNCISGKRAVSARFKPGIESRPKSAIEVKVDATTTSQQSTMLIGKASSCSWWRLQSCVSASTQHATPLQCVRLTGSQPDLGGSASMQPNSIQGSGSGQLGTANLEGAESLPGWQSLPVPMQASSASGSTDDLISTANLRGATITIAEEQERSLGEQWPKDVSGLLDGDGAMQKVKSLRPSREQLQEVCAADDDASVRGGNTLRSMRLANLVADTDGHCRLQFWEAIEAASAENSPAGDKPALAFSDTKPGSQQVVV